MVPFYAMLYPCGLADEKERMQALSLISPPTLNAFIHRLLIMPFSHYSLLNTHNPPLLILTPPFCHMVFLKRPFHTPDFASSPNINQNKVDSQSWSSNTPINHKYQQTSTPLPPQKKAPSSIKHPKHSHLYLKTTLFTPSLSLLTCRKPEKTPVNFSEGKSLSAFIFKAEPLGL